MVGDMQGHLKVYTQTLNLRAHRQQVLASNIANADTPHYKARDFDFKAAFAQATGKREGLSVDGVKLDRTHASHLAGQGSGMGGAELLYRTETQSAVDGNTVDMDVERAQIADNAMQYQIVSQFLSDKISGMRRAISSNQG